MEAGHNKTEGPNKREQLRIEFYATYDVMTGIRIAATLGGFFGLMVFLVIYKSRSKSVKALKDPKIAEIAAAAVAEEEAEEEERQLAYALEEALEARFSLGAASPWPHRGPRFSSVGGGYSSLLAPPRRLSKMRGDSLPGSALRFDCRPPFFEDDIEMTEAVDDSYTAPSEYVNRFLAVPGGSRRYSSMTCSSSGSSYLERRGSSIVCALPNVPPAPGGPARAPRPRAGRRCTLQEAECRDVLNPIDIQVIQPTPELSPCVSEHTILNCEAPASTGKRFESAAGGSGELRGPAPLASLGSCGVSLSVDYKDYDLHSVGSDSVFFDEDECLDTDDEIEQFSTDSDESLSFKHRGHPSEESKELRPRRRSRHIVGKSIPVASSPPLSGSAPGARCPAGDAPAVRKHRSFLSKPLTRAALRRLSHPTVISRRGCCTISGAVRESPPISRAQDVELGCRPPATAPLASSGSVDYTARSPSPLNPEHCSWSQETLF